MRGVKALILAGQREGVVDPLLVESGTQWKALLPIHGRPMIAYVLDALEQAETISKPYGICGLDVGLVESALGEDTIEPDELQQYPSSTGPASSVVAAYEAGLKPPFLVTTADHPLLSNEMVDDFVIQSLKSGQDFTLALASRDVVAPAYPHVKRTYLKFSDQHVSGCNLFFIANDQGMQAIRFWQAAQNDRKKPIKLALRFGLGTLLRYAVGRLSLEGAFKNASKKLNIKAKPVLLPYAEAAIDVDKPSDLALVTDILAVS